MYAIEKTLQIIEQYNTLNFVIFSDSESALQLVASTPATYQNIVNNIKYKLHNINLNRHVLIHWVKGHANIVGSEAADKLAKMAVNNDRSVYCLLVKEEKLSCLQEKFLNHWDESWKVTCQASGKGLALLKVRDSIKQNPPIYKLKNRQYIDLGLDMQDLNNI